MSNVTNIILITESNEVDALENINLYLLKEYPLNEDLHFSNVGFSSGGNKCFEKDIFLGAFNCFDLKSFLSVVTSQFFSFPGSVQVFVKREDDEIFLICDLEKNEVKK